jgi:hypothetical protein
MNVSAQFRRQLVVSGVVVALAASGCAVGGKSMSIDSTSKMPWFGLELRERKKKQHGPAFPSVRLDEKSKANVQPASLSDGSVDEVAVMPRHSLTLPRTDQSLLDPTSTNEPVALDFR